MVRALISESNGCAIPIDVNLRNTEDGATAAYVAAQEGHAAVINALAEHKKINFNITKNVSVRAFCVLL